ncbi:MAG: cytochrome P450 [Leifsonia flava]
MGIPKGTLILWSAHLAGRNAVAWPDPLRFDPDRFVGLDDDRRALAEMTWVPFGRAPATASASHWRRWNSR